jgi:hypothetical protein
MQISRSNYSNNNGLTTLVANTANAIANKALANYEKSERPKKRKSTAKQHKVAKRTRGRSTKPNMAAGISTFKANVRVKGKLKQRGVKRVKTTPLFRKKVKQVLEGAKLRGQFRSDYMGFIGLIQGGTTPNGNYSSSAILTLGGVAYDVNRQAVWGAPYAQTGASSNGYVAGYDWALFTPARVLDAASILWGRKNAARDYAQMTNNISLNVGSTGIPSTNNVLTAGGIKVMVQKSWTEFRIKNDSSNTMYIKMFIAESKKSTPQDSPVAEWLESMQQEAVATSGNGTNVASISVGEFQTDPRISPAFNQRWKLEERTIVLEPGQNIIQFIQGPKNTLYDFNKFGRTKTGFGGETMKDYWLGQKGYGKHVFFTMHGSPAYRLLPTSGFGVNFGVDGNAVCPVSWSNHFILSMPEQAGFIINGNTSGSQLLNNRSYRYLIYNALSPVGITADDTGDIEVPAEDPTAT